MTPYRRQLVGLPLQRSLFREIARAGDMPGLAALLPVSPIRAWLDEHGNLYLDRPCVEPLATTPPCRPSPEGLEELEQAQRSVCDSLADLTEQAARSAAELEEARLRRMLHELGLGVARLIPYGILAKVVPDALLRALRAEGDDGLPPFPARSAGVELMHALTALHNSCCAQGYFPGRLESEWPNVGEEVAILVQDFCRRQAGFGSLAWEAPGYEEPLYVCRTLRAVFGADSAEELPQRLPPLAMGEPLCDNGDRTSKIAGPVPVFAQQPPASAPRRTPIALALRRVLAFWLDFLERETWYVRRAFHAGMVPLLRRLVPLYRRQAPAFRPEYLLFLEIEELTSGIADLAEAEARCTRYWADSSYLSRQGIQPGRLMAILEEA